MAILINRSRLGWGGLKGSSSSLNPTPRASAARPPRAQERAARTHRREGHEHALRRSSASLPHAII